MPTTYSASLRLSILATGEQAGNWGNITNTNLGTLLEDAIAGYVNVSVTSDANYTLTTASGAVDEARNQNLKITSTVSLTATRIIIIPNVQKSYLIWNSTTGGQTLRIGTSGAPSVYVDIAPGYACHLFCDGADNVYQTAPQIHTSSFSVLVGSLTPTSSTIPTNGVYLPAANTLGFSTNTTARYYIGPSGQLGIGGATYGTSGQALKSGGPSSPPTWGDVGSVTSVAVSGGTTGLTTSGGPITGSGTITLAGTLGYANGGTGVTALPANGEILIGNGSGYSKATLTAGTNVSIVNGAGTITINATSSGTVSSVGASFTGGLISVSGSPVTTSGTLAFTIAGTSGGIPYFNSATGWASSAALAANALVIGGGAGVAPSTTTTGTGVISALAQTTNTATGFVTGSGTVTLSNKTISGASNTITNVSLTSGVTGTLPIASGGTGITTTPLNGRLLIGNGTGYASANLTAGTGIGVSDGAGTITISTSGAYTANGYTMATARLLGRTTAATGSAEELSVGTGLVLSGGSLTPSVQFTSLGSGLSVIANVLDVTSTPGIAVISGPTSLSGTAVSITSIPATYSYLVLYITGASFGSAGNAVLVRCDTDNGASYDSTTGNYVGYSVDAGTVTNNTTYASLLPNIGTSGASDTVDATIVIMGYQAGPEHMRVLSYFKKTGVSGIMAEVTWLKGTSALNALQILGSTGGTFDAGSYTLYGCS